MDRPGAGDATAVGYAAPVLGWAAAVSRHAAAVLGWVAARRAATGMPLPGMPVPWPPPGGWAQPNWLVPKQTTAQRRAGELAQVRRELEALTGSPAVPAAAAVPMPAPTWLIRSVLALAVLGLAFWPAALAAALLVAVPLVGAGRRHEPVPRRLQLASVAVLVAGYPWLASMLALWLFPGTF